MPCTQIAMNAGVDAAVVTQKVLDGTGEFGYDALKGEYVNMIESGIIDPTKVFLFIYIYNWKFFLSKLFGVSL